MSLCVHKFMIALFDSIAGYKMLPRKRPSSKFSDVAGRYIKQITQIDTHADAIKIWFRPQCFMLHNSVMFSDVQ
jgi:hypothetical protein